MKKVFKKIFYYSYIFKLLNLVFYKKLESRQRWCVLWQVTPILALPKSML